jgi:lipopolysaccharide export system permease protein
VTKLDKYILAQLIGPFAFFCFIISGILWLNQALGIVSIVTENGQPASIFVELSILLLPKVLVAAIPIAGFAAGVFLTNRLFGEAELVVMMSAGRSFVLLAKPFLIFGCLCFAFLFIVVHYMGPIAQSKLLDRQDKIKREYVTQIVQPGQFIASQEKYTFFFGEKGKNGELKDVLIQEQASPELTVTYIAQDGQVVKDNAKTTLVLKSGSIQRYNTETEVFSLVQFETLAFDMTQIGKDIAPRLDGVSEFVTPRLSQEIDMLSKNDPSLGRAVSLYHDRHAKTLLALLFPVLGMSVLLVGGYRRSGFALRIVTGVLLMAGLDSFRGATKSWAAETAGMWPTQYLSPMLCVSLIGLLLWLAAKNTQQFNPFARRVLT